jgi:hypothetical protein
MFWRHGSPAPSRTLPPKNVPLPNHVRYIDVRLIKLILQHLIKIVFVVAANSIAYGQTIGHGTYFIADVFPDYAVVAIDSRLVRSSAFGFRDVNDSFCKIHLLSKDAVFFATGSVTANDIKGNFLFDARKVAQAAFDDEGGVKSFSHVPEICSAK